MCHDLTGLSYIHFLLDSLIISFKIHTNLKKKCEERVSEEYLLNANHIFSIINFIIKSVCNVSVKLAMTKYIMTDISKNKLLSL